VRQLLTRARDLEAAKVLELAIRLYIDLGRALGEEIERGPVTSARFPRSPREHRLHAGLAREEANDPRALEIIECMEDDRFRNAQRHERNLTLSSPPQPGSQGVFTYLEKRRRAGAEEDRSARSGIVEDLLVALVECVFESRI